MLGILSKQCRLCTFTVSLGSRQIVHAEFILLFLCLSLIMQKVIWGVCLVVSVYFEMGYLCEAFSCLKKYSKKDHPENVVAY